MSWEEPVKNPMASGDRLSADQELVPEPRDPTDLAALRRRIVHAGHVISILATGLAIVAWLVGGIGTAFGLFFGIGLGQSIALFFVNRWLRGAIEAQETEPPHVEHPPAE